MALGEPQGITRMGIAQAKTSKPADGFTEICNAGIDTIKPAEDYENDECDRILDVNLKGAYFCSTSTADTMPGETPPIDLVKIRECPL